MAYCQTKDLLSGEIPLPSYVNTQQWIDNSADEIDAILGMRYATPIELSENVPEQRAGAKLLKIINARLATGRIIMAAAAGGEDDKVHAYASFLIRDALSTLRSLAKGEPPLPGATENPTDQVDATASAPVVHEHENRSRVDEFYSLIEPRGMGLDTSASPYYMGY